MGKKGIILTLVSLALAGAASIVSNIMMQDEVKKAIAEAKEEEEADETEEDS